jgi:glycosyltransferase involved in cell wall biosynthesis
VATRTPATVPLLVFADDWGRHPSSTQHLIRILLDRHEVYWINTIGTRAPGFNFATVSRGFEKLRAWSSAREKPELRLPGLHVLNPKMWPWFRSAFDRRLNRFLLLQQVGPLVKSLPTAPIAITMLPIVADLIGQLPVQRWVYYCVDDFALWPGLDQAPLERMEEQLIRQADIRIATSEILQDKLAQTGSTYLLTHGINLDFWRPREDSSEPIAELNGLERPLIVFWGLSDRRMDLAILRRLSAELTAGTIALVGPELNPDPALYGIKRVVHLGVLPYHYLPLVANQAAVLIMPYLDLPVTQAMQPVKLKEYLATGKPTVVRNLPAVRPWADCLDMADTPEAFSQAVRLRLAEGLPEEQRRARARLTQESWTEKARAFERWILEPPPCLESLTCSGDVEEEHARDAASSRAI